MLMVVAGLMGKPQSHVVQDSQGEVRAAVGQATAPATIWNQASAEPLDPCIKGSPRLSRPALPPWERTNWDPRWEVGVGDPGLLQQSFLGPLK